MYSGQDQAVVQLRLNRRETSIVSPDYGIPGNWGTALGWAKAGNSGWPGVNGPPGDANNCPVGCPKKFNEDLDPQWRGLIGSR